MEFIEAEFLSHKPDYITDWFVESIHEWVSARGQSLSDQADKYRSAENYPTRYSYYWADVTQSASNIVVILRISHINRRHALSNDGWAMMTQKVFIHFNINDAKRDARVAS